MRILILILILTSCVSNTNAANLIQNGGFEKGSMEYWLSNQQVGGKKKLFVISNEVKSGKFALCNSGDLKNKFNSFITLVQPVNAEVIHGKQYQLHGFVKSDIKNPNGKSFAIAVRQVNAKGGSITYTKIPIDLKNNTWHYCIKQFTPNEQTVKFQVYLIASKLTSKDKIYIDDISLNLVDDVKEKFDPSKKHSSNSKVSISEDDLVLDIDKKSGLLCALSALGQTIHPNAAKVSCVYLLKDGKEILFKRKAGEKIVSKAKCFDTKLLPQNSKVPFSAKVKYELVDGCIYEKVSFTATEDIDSPMKIGVRHGLDTKRWEKIFCALRPLRIISSSQPTIFSFRSQHGDLNLSQLEQFQRAVYPFVILENKDYFLLTGSRNLDQFVTVSPNKPEGYVPSVQQNPMSVRKGQKFNFELMWKIFPKKQNMLRDVWRWYSENIYSNNPLISNYVPYKSHPFRTFFPGCFASSTYFEKKREERLFPASNVWFFSWHDNINEWYPTEGSWWLNGNSWKFKMTASKLKKYVSRLQSNGYKMIFYLRQLANLRLRGKEKPESWYRKTAGGALDLYGGGHETKLPANVAADIGYDTIQWGTYDFDNDDFRNNYVNAVKKVIKFYDPDAIGWDMGWHPNHTGMFAVQAEIYQWIKNTYPEKKVVSNESSGPTQFYSDMVLIENGVLAGKSKYDFEIAKGQNTSMVCLERWNLFLLAVKANLTGCKTWLSSKGLAENKRYLSYLLKKTPALKANIKEAARLCQLRACLYDLALGASPGYMEEAKPIPPALVKMAGDANGLPLITESFMVKLPNGMDIDKNIASSVWLDAKSCRVVIHNDQPRNAPVHLTISSNIFKKNGWSLKQVSGGTAVIVTPEGEKITHDLNIKFDKDIHLNIKIPPFAALIYSKEKTVN